MVMKFMLFLRWFVMHNAISIQNKKLANWVLHACFLEIMIYLWKWGNQIPKNIYTMGYSVIYKINIDISYSVLLKN